MCVCGGFLPRLSISPLSHTHATTTPPGAHAASTKGHKPGAGGGQPKALGLGGRRQLVNTAKTEVWVAARVATLAVTGKEMREGLLRGIGLYHDEAVRCVFFLLVGGGLPACLLC